MKRTVEPIQLLTELSFSAYVGLLALTEEEACRRSSILLQKLGAPLKEYVYPFLTDYHIHLPGSHSIALWCLLGLSIFLSLRLSCSLRLTEVFLRYVPGFVALTGFPVLLLPICNLAHRRFSWLIWSLLYCELSLCLLYLIFYVLKKGSRKVVLNILLLILHFGIWGLVAWQRISTPFWAVYLFVGFCAACAWAMHFGQAREISPENLGRDC